MAKIAFMFVAAAIVFLAVEIYCWPYACPNQHEMRRDIDDKRQAHPHCRCGNLHYNPERELCCRGLPYPKHFGHLCCGGRTYNCYSQLCCKEGVRNKIGNECCRQSICTDNWNHLCCSSTTQCCGSRPYDPARQTCCKGKVLSTWGISSPACCGTSVYDSKEKMCCSGRVSHKPMGAQNPKCCGTSGYNPATEECCYGAYVRNKGCCNPRDHKGSVPWHLVCRI